MQNQSNDYIALLAQLKALLAEIAALKALLFQNNTASPVITGWVPKKDLMTFLGYGDTQIASLLNSGELVVATVGKRKFVQLTSLLNFLEKNIQS